MESNGDNWVVGAYVVNHAVNKRSQFNRGEKFSPYNFYYGKTPLGNKDTIFGEVAQKKCESEYGIIVANLFCNKAQKISKMRLVTEEELSYVMKKGDEVSELVTSGNLNFVYIEDYKEASREVAQDALEEFNFFGDDITKEGKEQQDTDNCGVTIASESKSKGSTCYSRNSGGNLSDGTNNVVDDTTTDEADSDYQDTPIRKGAKYQSKINLFEGEIRAMKKQHNSIIQKQESVDEADNESVDTFIKRTIKQHKIYRKPKASKTTFM